MISYKDKLLFLAFKKIMTFYLHFIETELNEESLSLELSKSNISTKLSTQDQKYACLLYDDMLFHNNQFKHLIKKLDSEISLFYSSIDFSFSIISIDNSDELSIIHLKKISSSMKSN